jgi:hypothetical protein
VAMTATHRDAGVPVRTGDPVDGNGAVPGLAAGTAVTPPDAVGPVPAAEAPSPGGAVRHRAVAPGVVRQLLRSAVALQAEDLLRVIGALAVAAHRSQGSAGGVDWISWVERDVRDLGRLARAALEVGARLPAGLDVGEGDPARPETLIEGLLIGHEEVLKVLRELDAVGGDEPWNEVVARIVARREAEVAALRVTVGPGTVEEDDVTHVGRAPSRHFTPDLLV